MGTVEPRKQQILLAQAFADLMKRHRDAVLLLVGDYPSHYSMALRDYLESSGVDGKIRLLPIVSDPYPWYAMADGFALLSDVESMPRSIMEAMGFGLPVLASRVFGIPELIDEGKTGLLIGPNSRRSAAEGLDKLLCLSMQERAAMGQAARERIRTGFDSGAHAEACLALIRGLVG